MSDCADRDSLYPLRFREILRNYSFGDRWIAREFAKSGLPEDHRIAETWEVCDRPKESSEILNGALAGRTLRQAIEALGPSLLGHEIMDRFGGRFPLLIKLLDATHRLAEQAHTSDEVTRRWGLADDFGKTEAWYMLRVRPGATISCGNRPGVTPAALADAIVAGRSKECMVEYPVRPHDAFLLYAGTMHYSPGGVLFYEIMQNSDVYVGLGPYGPDVPEEEKRRRAERAMEAVHLEEGFDGRTKPVTVPVGRNWRTFAIACEHFAVERLDLTEVHVVHLDGRRFTTLTAIDGRVAIGEGAREVELLPGQTSLLPAAVGPTPIRPLGGGAAVLQGYVPNLMLDVVEPLRAAGVPGDDIRALGGQTRLNPLNALL